MCRCEIVASEPIVSYRETVLSCDPSYKHTLPSPWCDTPYLHDASASKYRMVTAGGNLSIHFTCFPLPTALVQLTEKHPESIWYISQLLTKLTWSPKRLYEYYIYYKASNRNNDTSVSEGSDSKGAWSQCLTEYCNIVQSKGASEQAPSNVLTDEPASYITLGGNKAGPTPSTTISDDDVERILSLLLSFGSEHVLSNLLIMSPTLELRLYQDTLPQVNYSEEIHKLGTITLSPTSTSQQIDTFSHIWSRLQSSVVAGFQEACSLGPLMNEPLHAVCYAIDYIEVNLSTMSSVMPSTSPQDIVHLFTGSTPTSTTASASADTALLDPSYTPTTVTLSAGQIISDVKNALKLAMLSCPLRIVEPMYACDLQCDQSQLGSLYGVLSKRRGEVTKEDIIDGTSLFILSALLPVPESFGFASELLRKTSGNATAPQLLFSHWNIVSENPFWRPVTADEQEEYGNNIDSTLLHNIYRIRIDQVRKRKGLAIEEKVVASAEKQRNMNKKK